MTSAWNVDRRHIDVWTITGIIEQAFDCISIPLVSPVKEGKYASVKIVGF